MTLLVLPSPRAYAARPEFDPAELTHQGHRGWLAPAPAALGLAWVTDAHCQAATATIDGQGVPWRLSGASLALPGIEVAMGWAIFDVDGPNHQRSAAWDDEIRDRLVKLPGLPHCFATRGGCRIMWRLGEPFAIKSTADAAAWKRTYLECCAWLARLGIEADKSCADWSRLFRLPRVRRDGVDVAPDFELGDPEAIGVLELEGFKPSECAATSDDASRYPAILHARGGRLIARQASEVTATSSFTLHAPRESDSERVVDTKELGLLGRLLLARGDIVGPRGDAFQIRCPNCAAHAKRPHESSDYALLVDGPTGRIACQRTACADMIDWLCFFSADELKAVGVRCGKIERVFAGEDSAGRARYCIDAAGLPYARISEGTSAWCALWRAAEREPPESYPDVQRALCGRVLTVEISGDRVTRILGLE